MVYFSDWPAEYSHIRLCDLDVVATLGIGGFGRVELVQYVFERSQTFALKCLKKQHIVNTLQQEHVFSEKNIMMSCRSHFVARSVLVSFQSHFTQRSKLAPCYRSSVERNRSYFHS